jgi:hypothetical protein
LIGLLPAVASGHRQHGGIAGGLRPHNLAANLVQFAEIAQGPWCIDMEQSLRSDQDVFDVDRARQVITVLAASVAHPMEPARATSRCGRRNRRVG